MAHVVAADDVRTVRQAAGMPVVGGTEKKRSRVDRPARRDNNLAGIFFDRAVVLDDDLRHFAPRAVGLQPAHQRVRHQRHVSVSERGIHAADLRIGFRVDQTRVAIARIAADAFACAGIFFIQHDAEWNMKRLQSQPRKILAQLLHAWLMANCGVRIGRFRTGICGVFAAIAVHVIDLLRLVSPSQGGFRRDSPSWRHLARLADQL